MAQNSTFLFYGFLAAWVLMLFYVISLARRGARLKKELEDVKQLVNSSHKDQQKEIPLRVR
jgi:CcmD family protein